jgi:glycosyltransferase involved in cell wall biosynthesis
MRSINVPNDGRVIAYIQDPIDFTLTGNIFQILFRSKSLKRTFALRWLQNADVILLNSIQAQRVLTKELGLPSRILYPTLVSFDNKEPPSHREKFFLSVGRIGFHPTYNILFKILKRIPEMEVVIAGSWSHSTKDIVELFSSDSEVKHRVHMKISPTDEELEALYKGARAFLYPGKENFGLSALEAASYGCPIVICRESGMCELLGESFVMPAQEDTESFVKLALQLLNDEQYAITEGLRIREILKKYDSSYHMENLKEIIEKIPHKTSR